MKRQVEAKLPIPEGPFNILAYAKDEQELMPDLAIVHEEMDPSKPVLVRIHSECMTGDVFGSLRCDCGPQLDESLRLAAKEKGVVIYLRQEGRGIGLLNKLKAYNLQTAGMDTLDANLHLGFEGDQRQYETAIYILRDLGIHSIRLLTNNPLKVKALEGEKDLIVVERVPLFTGYHDGNRNYLETKKNKMGHLY
ncbi:MAG TPA: GTP cyclohydrolase II [Saprospiraceae bacterium]|nr:GTP cyclohydrolase II [Saprospiraceae bacterium]